MLSSLISQIRDGRLPLYIREALRRSKGKQSEAANCWGSVSRRSVKG